MGPWTEKQGKIKIAYNMLEQAYNKVEAGVGRVKEHKILNIVVREAIRNIPAVGDYLLQWYDDTGGSEEDKSGQILQFLNNLQQQNEEQFNRISEDLKINFDEIIKNGIQISELISKTSTEILEQTRKVSQDTAEIKVDTAEIKVDIAAIRLDLREARKAYGETREIRNISKPSKYRGEKPFFVGRNENVDSVKEYLRIPGSRVSIVGLGGTGKSALAFKAIHESEDIFDVIVPIYFEPVIKLSEFLAKVAEALELPKEELAKLDTPILVDKLIDALGRNKDHPLIFADNYENISGDFK